MTACAAQQTTHSVYPLMLGTYIAIHAAHNISYLQELLSTYNAETSPHMQHCIVACIIIILSFHELPIRIKENLENWTSIGFMGK